MRLGDRTQAVRLFNQPGKIEVLVLSLVTSTEGLNLHPQCSRNIFMEQGVNHSSEYQAWSRVRRIGQRDVQSTTRIVNMETIDKTIERAQLLKQTPMLYAFGALDKLQAEGGGSDFSSKDLFDILIGRRNPMVLMDRIIGGENEDDAADLDKGKGVAKEDNSETGSPPRDPWLDSDEDEDAEQMDRAMALSRQEMGTQGRDRSQSAGPS